MFLIVLIGCIIALSFIVFVTELYIEITTTYKLPVPNVEEFLIPYAKGCVASMAGLICLIGATNEEIFYAVTNAIGLLTSESTYYIWQVLTYPAELLMFSVLIAIGIALVTALVYVIVMLVTLVHLVMSGLVFDEDDLTFHRPY